MSDKNESNQNLAPKEPMDISGELEDTLILVMGRSKSIPTSEDIQREAERLAPVFGVENDKLIEIVKKVQAKLVHTMDEGVSLINYDTEHDEDWPEKENAIEWNYWGDYDKHMLSEGWTPKILVTLGEVTKKILGLMKNPQDPGAWDRRGLVIGDVQSGKTANYLGVITKAADAGYKFIIVIAGIHNNLRKQTQERINEGFIGRDDKRQPRGVGLKNVKRAFPVTLTTTTSDFSKKQASTFIADLKGFNRPVIVVIKKNVTTLRNLHDWLKDLNATPGTGQIADIPMLMIDDEADHASINTNKSDLDPTRTNSEIRKILKLFKKSSYVGYTATPFANIFINPESREEMLDDDLFPRDFIYCLDPPTNYFGARKVFLDENESEKILQNIDDAEKYIPHSHKRSFEIKEIPGSLRKSIILFLLGRAIRILRDQGEKHCSMMVNVSRFVDVQRQVRELISYNIETTKRAIQFNYALPVERALKNEDMIRLKENFDEEFSGHDEKWDDVQRVLFDAVKSIKVFLINSKSDETLDYKKAEAEGDALTAIAVGGLSLSRGLTLEGLSVSYMYRNSKMYDTVMQMGRWFGYRPGYEDLCRVFLTEDSQGWYKHIAEATDELRQQVNQMRRDRLSPKDFGLYVRAHPDTLVVTAINKMRDAQSRVFKVNFDGKLIETYILSEDESLRGNNIEYMRSIYNKLKSEKGEPIYDNRSYFWANISWEVILEFLQNYKFHDEFQGLKESLRSYIHSISEKFSEWDIAFVSLKNTESSDRVLPIASQKRCVGITEKKIKKPSNGDGWYVGNRQRVAGTNVEKVGLSEEQIELANKIADDNKRKVSDRDFRHINVRGKPLLMLHLIDLFEDEKKEKLIKDNIPALGISFPVTGNTESVDCVVNKVWVQMDMFESPDEEDDYDN